MEILCLLITTLRLSFVFIYRLIFLSTVECILLFSPCPVIVYCVPTKHCGSYNADTKFCCFHWWLAFFFFSNEWFHYRLMQCQCFILSFSRVCPFDFFWSQYILVPFLCHYKIPWPKATLKEKGFMGQTSPGHSQ